MKKLLLIALGMLILLSACAPATSQPSATPAATETSAPPAATATATQVPLPAAIPNTLLVDPSIARGTVSPYVYGTNYGPMHAITAGAMPMVESAGFKLLRFPAGAWTDTSDIKPFQIDQFMAFCKKVGATPIISVRLLNGTAKAAADLVRYTNIQKKYGVLYWSIGNEPSIYTQLKQADYDYTTENLNRDWRPIAEAMKKVDPSIQLIGPDIHQWNLDKASTPKDSAGRDWMEEFLKANGDMLDIVSVHRYPMYSPNNPVTIQDLRENTRRWGKEVEHLRTVTREIIGRELPIAITEVNSDPSSAQRQDASPDTFYNAIWYADVIGQVINADVFMVNQWVISQRSTGLGLLNGDTVRPTFYVFPLYKNFGSEKVFAVSGMADVDIFASKRADGALTLMIINLGDNEQKVPLQISGMSPSEAEVWLLDATHNAENLGVQALPADGVLTLPGQSATLYVLK